MELQHENRADQLEKLLSLHSGQYSSAQMRTAVPDGVDAEMHEMVMLAQQLRRSPALIPDPAFAQRLERKILAHKVALLQTNKQRDKPYWLMSGRRVSRVQLVFALFLLFLLISTNTILAKAATVSNPDNPLYRVKVWEQQVQLSLVTSPQSRADISMQIINDRLNTISSLTDPAHASAYQQALDDIQQQIDTVTSIINALPAGIDRQKLSADLATLKTGIRHTLYGRLAKIPLAEQLSTSSMLGQLGIPVPNIQSVTVVVLTHPTSQATITITGTNLTDRTHLIVNNQVIPSVCELQNNSCIFTIPWHNKKKPTVIVVTNADGTATQINLITPVSANGKNSRNKQHRNNVLKKHNSSINNHKCTNVKIQYYNNEDLEYHFQGDNQYQDNADIQQYNNWHDTQRNSIYIQYHNKGYNQYYNTESIQYHNNIDNQQYNCGNNQKHGIRDKNKTK